MLKKLGILFAVLVCLTALVAGCGGKKEAGKETPKAEGKQEKITIKISYENNPGEPVDKAVREWGRLIKEKSNGKVEFEYYPSSQLGSKKDVTEQAMLGANIILITDASFLMDYVPDIGILSGPYLVDNFDQLFKLTESDWFKEQAKKLEQKGVHIVTTKWIYGVRHMVTTKPVKKPEDLKGLKIRVPNNKLFIETINAMGGTATPMPWAEAYPAIMQGVVNGAENPLPVLYGAKLYEGAKNLSLTGHIHMISQWIAGQKFIDKLPPDVVKLLHDTGDEAAKTINQQIEAADKETLEKFKAAGVNIVEVDREAFRNAVKVVYTKFPEWTPGLYDKLQAMIK